MKMRPDWHLPNHAQAARRTRKDLPTLHLPPLEESSRHLGDGKKYFISTYGCQANERDTENLSGLLEAMGYLPADSAEDSDLILLNTCGIRENASNNVLGEVGSYKRLWMNNKNLIIGICGCMSQEEGFVETLLEKYPQVRLIFGTHNIPELPALIEKVQQGQRAVEVYSREGEVYEGLPEKRKSRHKAWVNIMYGCDKFCTYCIVPYTRGQQRSRHAEEIVEEIRTLKKLGYREITLLGQNVNAYGKDLPDQPDFAGLLELAARTGMERIRFMTSHPWDFSDAMIDVIAKYGNIMPYVHLPLQSGDDDVLRRMGRRYSRKQYLELFHKIRERIPGVSVSTDIIVGFPDESEEAFEHTLDVVRECAFDSAFTFIYSPRPGTPAAVMDDPVDLDTKKARLQRLNQLWNELALERNRAWEGRVTEVLCDGPSKKDEAVYSGYTPEMKLVNFTADHAAAGDLIQVVIDQAKTFSMDGHALSEEEAAVFSETGQLPRTELK